MSQLTPSTLLAGATARQEAVRRPLRLHRGGPRAAVPRRPLQGAVEHHEQLQGGPTGFNTGN